MKSIILLGVGDNNRLFNRYLTQTPKYSGKWKSIQLIQDPKKADYAVVLDDISERNQELLLESKLPFIYLQREPSEIKPVTIPQGRLFYQGTYDRLFHLSTWMIKKSYDELIKLKQPKKTRLISTIVSNKQKTYGQKKRLELTKQFEKSKIDIDVYGRVSPRKFTNHHGELEDKSDGILPYSFHLAIENSSHRNYFTEKILDSLLLWSKPLYWGCENIADFFPKESYIWVDITNPDIDIIKYELERKIDYQAISKARDLILNEYNLMTQLDTLLTKKKLKMRPRQKRTNKLIGVIWPRAFDFGLDKKIINFLSNHGSVRQLDTIAVDKPMIGNLLQEIHLDKQWWEKHLNREVNHRYSANTRNQKMIVFEFGLEDSIHPKQIKKLVRQTFGITKEMFHLSDPDCAKHLGEPCECAIDNNELEKEITKHKQLLLNKNTLHWLRWAKPKSYVNFDRFLNEFEEQRPELKRTVVLNNGAALAAYGIRDVHDLDFLAKTDKGKITKDIVCHNNIFSDIIKHTPQLKYNIKDLVDDSEKYFYYRGWKIMALDLVREIKLHRLDKSKNRRYKDVKDTLLINQFLQRYQKKLIVKTAGGLGNRLRTIGIYNTIAQATGRKLEIDWTISKMERTEPLDELIVNDFALSQSKPDYSFSINYGISKDAQFAGRGNDSSDVYSKEAFKVDALANILEKTVAVNTLVKFEPTFISEFKAKYRKSLQSLLPAEHIWQAANDFGSEHKLSESIGFHIRRTDRVESTKVSTDEKFVHILKKIHKKNKHKQIFLATDSNDTQKFFLDSFENILIYKIVPKSRYGQPLSRIFGWRRPTDNKVSLIEILLLSQCEKIYGSWKSSFSQLAADWGNKPLEIVK